jgi:hypothetical protein
MLVVPLGIVRLVIPAQYWNAVSPIESRLEGRDRLVMLVAY